MTQTPIRRALISVSDKTGLTDLGQALASRGVEILSTGGSAAALRDEYVAAFAVLSSIGRLTVAGLGVDVEPYDPNANYEKNNDRLFGFERDELTEWKAPAHP